ncbi:MAG: hypothetical protein ACEQSH_00050 [Bacteroidia bacterium]
MPDGILLLHLERNDGNMLLPSGDHAGGEEAHPMTYTVVYYIGGTERGSWKRTLAVPTQAEAAAMVADIERGGRVALYNRTEVWDAIGLPEGAPVHLLRRMGAA